MPKLSKEERKSILRAMSLLMHLSISIVVCVGLSIFIGRTLDNWLNTTPWLLLVFVFLGVIAAFKLMYDMAKRGHS